METPASLYDRPPDFFCRIKVESHVVKKSSRPLHINRKTGNRFIGKSAALVAGENWMILNLLKARRETSYKLPIQGPVSACFRFFFSDFYRKDGKQRENLADLSNLVQLPEDCLQKAGIIFNDRQIFSLDGSRRLPGSETALEIWLWEIKE